MRIFDRYIIRRFGVTLLFAVVSFILVVVFVDMVGNLGKFIDKEVPAPVITKYYLLYIPYILTLVLPIAMLLASMFSLGQMARYNELLAIRTAGISLNRILLPLFVLSFVISAGALVFGEKIAPHANQEKTNIEDHYLEPFRSSNLQLENLQYHDEQGRRILIGRYDDRKKTAFRVTIQTFRANVIQERIDAKSMAWQNGAWVLQDGFRRTFENDREQATHYDTLPATGLHFKPEELLEQQARPEDMSYSELRQFIADVIRNGGDPKKWQVDLHFKLSAPFASFILVLFGAPLASNKNRGGAIFGLIASLAIYMAYFGISRLFKTLGEVGDMAPLVAGWLTNGSFLALGVILLFGLRK